MRVGIAYPYSATKLDPAAISTAFEYDILQNIYGRLLKYDKETQLVVDLPTSFVWSDKEVRFEFGDKAKTISGHVIDASDAELSLKRLVMKGRSGHGDIRRFLCPGYELKSLSDACPGIRVEANTLILEVVNADFMPMLLGALESADYSILPRTVIDEKTGDLKDKSQRETSGPYYVEKDSETGHTVLSGNKYHYLYHPEMPQLVEVVPNTEGGPLQGFKEGKIDYLPTSAYFTGELGQSIINDKSNDINETLPISVTFARFSPSALKEFSIEQRMYAGLVAGFAFIKHFGSIGGRPTEQFFQTFSDGTLEKEDLEKIKSFRERLLANPPKFNRPIVFGVPDSKLDVLANELRSFPAIKVVGTGMHPINLKPEERPEMYYSLTDSAWAENMSLIGYNFESGNFYYPSLNPDSWFQNYISVQDKEERMRLLRKLHLDVLENASIVPVEVAPYFAAARDGWKLNQSRIMIGTELWAMRRN